MQFTGKHFLCMKRFPGKPFGVWEGEVEVFKITGHPTAKRCYGWLPGKGIDDQGERFVTILEIPPVVSPETAVRTSVLSDSKNSESFTKSVA